MGALAIAVCTASVLATLAAHAGATQTLEQRGEYNDSCSFHYGELESDARQVARDFCVDRGGVRSIDEFERSEELVRPNEFSTRYRCRVASRVECYAES